MMKNSYAPKCLLIALSTLNLSCGKNLPEPPRVINNFPAQTQAASVPQAMSVLSPGLKSEVTYEEKRIKSGSNPPLEIVANDLVKALSFISGMDPELNSIGTPASTSVFDKLVKKSMLEQGYNFNDGPRTGSWLLTTSFLQTNSESQPAELTAIMAIDSVLIKRAYLIQNDFVEPNGSYIIRGVNPELVDSGEQTLSI